jgi:hypothetical protein
MQIALANGFELSGAGSFHQFGFSAESGVRFSELLGCHKLKDRIHISYFI